LSKVVAVVTLLVMVSVVRGTPHPITICYLVISKYALADSNVTEVKYACNTTQD